MVLHPMLVEACRFQDGLHRVSRHMVLAERVAIIGANEDTLKLFPENTVNSSTSAAPPVSSVDTAAVLGLDDTFATGSPGVSNLGVADRQKPAEKGPVL